MTQTTLSPLLRPLVFGRDEFRLAWTWVQHWAGPLLVAALILAVLLALGYEVWQLARVWDS